MIWFHFTGPCRHLLPDHESKAGSAPALWSRPLKRWRRLPGRRGLS